MLRPGVALERTREVGRILESAGTLLSSPAPETPWNRGARRRAPRRVARALSRDVIAGIEDMLGGDWGRVADDRRRRARTATCATADARRSASRCSPYVPGEEHGHGASCCRPRRSTRRRVWWRCRSTRCRRAPVTPRSAAAASIRSRRHAAPVSEQLAHIAPSAGTAAIAPRIALPGGEYRRARREAPRDADARASVRDESHCPFAMLPWHVGLRDRRMHLGRSRPDGRRDRRRGARPVGRRRGACPCTTPTSTPPPRGRACRRSKDRTRADRVSGRRDVSGARFPRRASRAPRRRADVAPAVPSSGTMRAGTS